MAVRYFEGSLAGASEIDTTAWRAGLDLGLLFDHLQTLIGGFEYNVAIQKIWSEVLDRANRYIQTTEPFKVVKTDAAAAKAILVNLAEAIRVIAILIRPFLPATAETFYHAFNFADLAAWETASYASILDRPLIAQLRVTAPLVGGKPAPLFPKIEAKPG
jgi:methionyl-tRNA synthetase